LENQQKIQVGGQAVIEGVMMRSPDRVSVAVRRPDGKIVLKSDPYISISKRYKFWGLPVLRGAVILIESMVLGIKALTFSGDVAITEEEKKQTTKQPPKKSRQGLSNLWIVGTVTFSLLAGLGLFFYLPLILTDLVGVQTGFWFNVVDGIFRVAIFLAYLGLIAQIKDIHRIFQYHGAEHQTIFAYEDGEQLSIENTAAYTPHHPRCGTSFIITVLLVSILVFMLLGKPDSIVERLVRLGFVPLIGGLSYEAIKLSDRNKNNLLVRLAIKPGLWLQRITALKPDESMLEVAIVALQGSTGVDFRDDERVVLASELSDTKN